MFRILFWLTGGIALAIAVALSFGAAQPIQALGYAHRNPNHFDLFLHDLAHDIVVNLTRTPDADEPEWDWSPDGSRFVFTHAVPGQARICILDQDVRCLPPQSIWDDTPRWSPDGTQVSFLTEHGDVMVWSVETDALRTYRIAGISISDTAWSPGGAQIATYGLHRLSGDMRFHLLDLATGQNELISGEEEATNVPMWSPDGDRLLYSVSTGIGHDILIANLAENNMTRLTQSGDNIDPVWSPDGENVIYLTWSRSGTTWTLHNLKTNIPAQFMRHNQSLDSRPVWSVDGRKIGFISYFQRRFSIWVIDMEGDQPHLISNTPYEYKGLAWHP